MLPPCQKLSKKERLKRRIRKKTLTLLIIGASDLSCNLVCVHFFFSVCTSVSVKWNSEPHSESLFIVSYCCLCFWESSMCPYSVTLSKKKKKSSTARAVMRFIAANGWARSGHRTVCPDFVCCIAHFGSSTFLVIRSVFNFSVCALLLVWDEIWSLILLLLLLSVVCTCVSKSSLWFPYSVTPSKKKRERERKKKNTRIVYSQILSLWMKVLVRCCSCQSCRARAALNSKQKFDMFFFQYCVHARRHTFCCYTDVCEGQWMPSIFLPLQGGVVYRL